MTFSALLWTNQLAKWCSPVILLMQSRFLLKQALINNNVVFVFGRYFEDSTKTYCRLREEKKGISRVHMLKPDMPEPPKAVILGVWKNKMQVNF